MLLASWYWIYRLRSRLKKTEKIADQAFKTLVEKAEKQITILEKSKKESLSSKQSDAIGELHEVIDQMEDIKKWLSR